MSSLVEMPPEVLQRILLFVSNPADLLSCELACHALKKVVADDRTWQLCHQAFRNDPRVGSNRVSACLTQLVKRVRKLQKCPDNILVDVLGVEAWKQIVRLSLHVLLPDDLTAHQLYFLRGDTMGYLLEVVQAMMHSQLQRANAMMCSEYTFRQVYPSLSQHYVMAQDALSSHSMRLDLVVPVLAHSRLTTTYRGVEILPFANSLIAPSDRDKMIRRVAFRAGVVKMENDIYDCIWVSAIRFIVQVLEPACTELVYTAKLQGSVQQGAFWKRSLSPGQTIDMVPPLSMPTFCDDCGAKLFVHTPVPKQIEKAASAFSIIPSKVYGDAWLPRMDSTKEEEMAAADAEYTDNEEEEDSDKMEVEMEVVDVKSGSESGDDGEE